LILASSKSFILDLLREVDHIINNFLGNRLVEVERHEFLYGVLGDLDPIIDL
jgi:hypothetical protein